MHAENQCIWRIFRGQITSIKLKNIILYLCIFSTELNANRWYGLKLDTTLIFKDFYQVLSEILKKTVKLFFFLNWDLVTNSYWHLLVFNNFLHFHFFKLPVHFITPLFVFWFWRFWCQGGGKKGPETIYINFRSFPATVDVFRQTAIRLKNLWFFDFRLDFSNWNDLRLIKWRRMI